MKVFILLLTLLTFILLKGETKEVIFSVDHSSIKLYKQFYIIGNWNKQGFPDDSYLCGFIKLYDDGTHGDEIAGDFIFTRKLHLQLTDKPFKILLFSKIPETFKNNILANYTFNIMPGKNLHKMYFPDFFIDLNPVSGFFYHFYYNDFKPYLFGLSGILFITLTFLIYLKKHNFFIKDIQNKQFIYNLFNSNKKIFALKADFDSFTHITNKLSNYLEELKPITINKKSTKNFLNFNSNEEFLKNINNLMANFEMLVVFTENINSNEIKKLSKIVQDNFCPIILVKSTEIINENIEILKLEKIKTNAFNYTLKFKDNKSYFKFSIIKNE